MKYYIVYAGRVIGPMTAEQLMAYRVDERTQVSTDGMHWDSLFVFPELQETLERSRRQDRYAYGAAVSAEKDDRQVVAGVLAILLGTLGVHYFYLGKTAAGLLSILISLCSCGLWSVVTLVQGVLMLTMPASEFRRKYVDTTAVFPLF